VSTDEATSSKPLALYTQLWADFFEQADAQGKAVLEFYEKFCDPRMLQRHWLEILSQTMEAYLRSPAFLEAMRTGLQVMTDIKALENQLVQDFARQVGLSVASDIDELSNRFRRREDILVTQLKAIEERLANTEKRHDSSQGSD
jgi:uncharacterized protein YhaN